MSLQFLKKKLHQDSLSTRLILEIKMWLWTQMFLLNVETQSLTRLPLQTLNLTDYNNPLIISVSDLELNLFNFFQEEI